MQTLIIHGRQPALGRAELESLYGPSVLQPIENQATIIDLPAEQIDFSRLGGMVKFAKVLTVLDTNSWQDIEKFLLDVTPGHINSLPEGKLKIGLSVYGVNTNVVQMLSTAIKLKKSAKQTGRNVRVIPNKDLALNSASVLYNKLTQKLGWELLFVRYDNKTIIAQSIAVQDIDAYRCRDQERPYRDARIGMLPPKLAQIIINLATNQKLLPKNKDNCGDSNQCDFTVLDPFCGTGVVLQESALMGYKVLGSDLEPRMVAYSQKNLDWLINTMGAQEFERSLAVGDATNHKWDKRIDTVACETYLGRALSSVPDPKTLQKIINDVDTIHKKFLKNIASQTKSGFRMCLAVPAWSISPNSKFQFPKSKTVDFTHLPTLEKLSELGYNRVKFVHASNQELIYHRPNQIVARELVVLIRK